MSLTIVAASPADRGARGQERARYVGVVLRLPGQHSFSRLKRVGAVEVQPDALREVRRKALLRQGRICTLGARVGARLELLDRAGEQLRVDVEILRLGAEHLGDGHRMPPSDVCLYTASYPLPVVPYLGRRFCSPGAELTDLAAVPR
jgi:hypothetical protein